MKKIAVIICVSMIFITSASPATPQLSAGHNQQEDPVVKKMERDAEKKRNLQRQTQLKQDADKLLELASQLKKQVDASNEHLLSLDVVKSAEQIEKLAHSVKEKMKANAYQPAVQ